MVQAVIRYLDVCSGYSAFTQANIGLPFECAGYAEIDAFPSAMLGHHYGASRPRYMPDPGDDGIDAKERDARIGLRKSIASLSDSHFGNRVTNFGDFTQIREDDVGAIDLLVGGTPCQAFSIAGKRIGLDDPRGNLTLEFLALAKRLRIPWLAWENVPGFLSHDDGRTMGTFVGLLGQLGYGWAYRVLDAQYVRVDGAERAVPQRRKRLFVVGHLGDAAGPAAVLFERESLRGDTAPRRETGQRVASPIAKGSDGGSGYRLDADTAENLVPFGGNNCSGPVDVAASLGAHGGPHGRQDFASETFAVVAPTLDASYGRLWGQDDQHINTGAGMFVAHPLLAKGNMSHRDDQDTLIPETARTLKASHDASFTGASGMEVIPVGFQTFGDGGVFQTGDITAPLRTGTDNSAQIVAFDTTQITSKANRSSPKIGDPSHPLTAEGHAPTIAFSIMPMNSGTDYKARETDVAQPLMAGGPVGGNQGGDHVVQNWAVRRLTPTECERLMGVFDDFTLIPYRGKLASDGPRYKALGNSQGRNVMRWIAHGLAMVMPASSSETTANTDTPQSLQPAPTDHEAT